MSAEAPGARRRIPPATDRSHKEGASWSHRSSLPIAPRCAARRLIAAEVLLWRREAVPGINEADPRVQSIRRASRTRRGWSDFSPGRARHWVGDGVGTDGVMPAPARRLARGYLPTQSAHDTDAVAIHWVEEVSPRMWGYLASGHIGRCLRTPSTLPIDLNLNG